MLWYSPLLSSPAFLFFSSFFFFFFSSTKVFMMTSDSLPCFWREATTGIKEKKKRKKTMWGGAKKNREKKKKLIWRCGQEANSNIITFPSLPLFFLLFVIQVVCHDNCLCEGQERMFWTGNSFLLLNKNTNRLLHAKGEKNKKKERERERD